MSDIHFCECPVCEGGHHKPCDACDGRGEVPFVPLARVLEIVEERISAWEGYPTTNTFLIHLNEARHILRLLREEFGDTDAVKGEGEQQRDTGSPE